MPDLKITTRHTFAGHSTESTEYIKADRKRSEYRNEYGYGGKPGGSSTYVVGPRLAGITRCDLGQYLELNLDAREYTSHQLPKWPSLEELKARAAKAPRPAQPPKPTVRVETATLDTGERREIFGYTARHVITTTKQVALEGAASQPNEQVHDGWYVDLDTRISCDPHYPSGGHASLAGFVGKIETYDFKHSGARETGYPVELKTTFRGTITLPDGKTREHTSWTELKIVELSTEPLDASLFKVPPEFRKVDHIDRDPKLPLSAWQRWLAWLAGLFR